MSENFQMKFFVILNQDRILIPKSSDHMIIDPINYVSPSFNDILSYNKEITENKKEYLRERVVRILDGRSNLSDIGFNSYNKKNNIGYINQNLFYRTYPVEEILSNNVFVHNFLNVFLLYQKYCNNIPEDYSLGVYEIRKKDEEYYNNHMIEKESYREKNLSETIKDLDLLYERHGLAPHFLVTSSKVLFNYYLYSRMSEKDNEDLHDISFNIRNIYKSLYDTGKTYESMISCYMVKSNHYVKNSILENKLEEMTLVLSNLHEDEYHIIVNKTPDYMECIFLFQNHECCMKIYEILDFVCNIKKGFNVHEQYFSFLRVSPKNFLNDFANFYTML